MSPQIGTRVVRHRLAICQRDDVASLRDRAPRGEHESLPLAVRRSADGRLSLEKGQVILDDQQLETPVIAEGDQ